MSALGHSRLIDMLATPLRCPLCSESSHRSHVELYEKTPRNGVVRPPRIRSPVSRRRQAAIRSGHGLERRSARPQPSGSGQFSYTFSFAGFPALKRHEQVALTGLDRLDVVRAAASSIALTVLFPFPILPEDLS